MSSIVQRLVDRELIRPPSFVPSNICYETLMGSVAYGVSSDTSDCDVYGFTIPTKELIFPHITGEIFGFGRQVQRFEQWQQHHIQDDEARKSYDCQIYSIIKYFQLVMDNNPNMIDSLFTPRNCILYSNQIGEMVREKRTMFLHKGAWHKFKGYSYSQLHKMISKNPIGKRKEIIKAHSFDTKFAYHVVRLLDEVEQILMFGDIDLQRAKEHLKAIRRGEVSEQEIRDWFAIKEKELEKLYHESKLPYGPDEDKIKELLLNCLEHHYGNLTNCVIIPGKAEEAIKKIEQIIQSYRNTS